ncbi:MAG: hypothetical protein Q9184_000246 [Pyrenodesmia sp. 2 TL-2023]
MPVQRHLSEIHPAFRDQVDHAYKLVEEGQESSSASHSLSPWPHDNTSLQKNHDPSLQERPAWPPRGRDQECQDSSSTAPLIPPSSPFPTSQNHDDTSSHWRTALPPGKPVRECSASFSVPILLSPSLQPLPASGPENHDKPSTQVGPALPPRRPVQEWRPSSPSISMDGTTLADSEEIFSRFLGCERATHLDLCLHREPTFDWKIDDGVGRRAKRCMQRVRNGVFPEPKLKGNEPDKSLLDLLTDSAWDFLVPDSEGLAKEHITTDFCQYFFFVVDKLENSQLLPYDVPFHIRRRIDARYYRAIWQIKQAQLPVRQPLARWITGLDGQIQGSSLVACLEIFTVTEGLKYCDNFFSKVTKEVKQLQTVKDVDEQQMANFFATYVRTVRRGLLQKVCPWTEWLEPAITYLARFWAFCPHLHNNQKARYALFNAVIAKLEVFDIVLCLWLFADVAKSTDGDENNDNQLCGAMEAECYRKLGRITLPETHWITTAVVVVNFLLNIGVDGFFDTLYKLMTSYCGCKKFETVWTGMSRLEEYKRLCETMLGRLHEELDI